MQAVAYHKNGEIFIRSNAGLNTDTVEKLQNDIDNILHLNGIKDCNGKIIHDTSTKIVAKRRSIYESVNDEFERWEKRKVLTSSFLQSKIDMLEGELKNDNIAQPFIGVKLYRYKKKRDLLLKQHK